MEGSLTSSPTLSKTVASLGVSDTVRENVPLAQSGVRRPFVIPKLDEKKLEMKSPETQKMMQPFVLLEGTANVAGPEGAAVGEGISAPVNGTPSFLLGPGGIFNCATVLAVDSPPANAAFIANAQQQFPQCVIAPTPAPTAEQELLLTLNYIQMCPREVLAPVLSSLVKENPALCPLIRQRCEKAVVYIVQHQQKQQQQAVASGGCFATHVPGGVQWAPRVATSNYDSPHGASFASSASPHASGGRKGRGGKFREEALCSVHNSMRSLNHLHINKQTGLYECVSGFHCLEDGGSAAVTPCNFKNTTGASATATNTNTLAFVVGDSTAAGQAPGGAQPILTTLPGHSAGQRDCRNLYDGKHTGNSAGASGNNINANSNANGHGGATLPEGTLTATRQQHTELRVEMLQNLLQSVREKAEHEK